MIRTLDVEAFNHIANHPEVNKWLGFSGEEIDLSEAVHNVDNVCLLTDNKMGGYILHNLGSGVFAAHTMAMPEARGKAMYKLMQEGFYFLFTHTNCVKVTTFCPDDNEKAISWTKLAGFTPTVHVDDYQFGNTVVPGQFYEMNYEDWVVLNHGCREQGELFHDLLEESQGHENHPEDVIHDSFVGATILGCKAGNAIKSIFLYNRWATENGYEPANVLSLTPVLVNIGSHLIQLNNGEIEILKVLEKASS